jgi:hypothetical protein
MKISLQALVIIITASVAAAAPCTDADMEILGNATFVGDIVRNCLDSGETQQEIAGCVSSQTPGLYQISSQCLLCSAAAVSAASQECRDACATEASSSVCVDCINNVESTWTAACNDKSSYRVNLFWMISALSLLLMLV